MEKTSNFQPLELTWKALCSKFLDIKPFLSGKCLIRPDVVNALMLDVPNECILGAVLAQEVIKNLTVQGIPIMGIFTFNAENNSSLIYS